VLLGVLLGTGLLASPPMVHGHTGYHRKTVRVLIKTEAIHLSVQVALPAGPEARRARLAWDANADGRIDRTERRMALDGLYERHCAGLGLKVDGRERAIQRRADSGGRLVGPTARDEAVSVSFQLEAAVPAGGGAHTLVLSEGRLAGQHVPTVLQVGRGVNLLGHDGLEQRRADSRQVVAVLSAGRSLSVSFAKAPELSPRAP
jgi:hypothetical protein